MNCKEFNAHIDDFMDDELDKGLRQEMESHQSVCPSCAAELALLQEALSAFSEESLLAPDAKFADDVMAKVRAMAKIEEQPSFFEKLSKLFREKKFALPAVVGAAAIVLFALFFQGGPSFDKAGKGKIILAQAPTSWLHEKMANGDLRPVVVGEKLAVSAEVPRTFYLADDRGEILAAGGTIVEATKEGLRQAQGTVRYDLDLAGQRFEVLTKHGKVVVWGTSFEVAVKESQTAVSVYEGKVRFEGHIKTLELYTGDRVTATMTDLNLTKPDSATTSSHTDAVAKQPAATATISPVDTARTPPNVTPPTVLSRPTQQDNSPADDEQQTGTSNGHKVDVTNTEDLERIFDK